MAAALHYTPVTLAQGDTISDVLMHSKRMPLFKRGPLRLVWVDAVDLEKLEAAGLAVHVEHRV